MANGIPSYLQDTGKDLASTNDGDVFYASSYR